MKQFFLLTTILIISLSAISQSSVKTFDTAKAVKLRYRYFSKKRKLQ
jgi:hypothetical protein